MKPNYKRIQDALDEFEIEYIRVRLHSEYNRLVGYRYVSYKFKANYIFSSKEFWVVSQPVDNRIASYYIAPDTDIEGRVRKTISKFLK